MNQMFCFQCEQTVGCKACTGAAGVCGKKAPTAQAQDSLTGALIALARAAAGKADAEVYRMLISGLFTTVTNVNFDEDDVLRLAEEARALRIKLGGGDVAEYDMNALWGADEDVRSLKSLTLFGLRGMAAYAYHALVLGYADDEVNAFIAEAMAALADDLPADQLLALVMKTGEVNFKCMALLDKANTESYGDPVPTQVPLTIEKGPFIVVSGHDLKDLELLLQQTDGKGINVYTHGEMLPAHAYPKLKAHPQLKGNFGTAWQNQQKEFADMPGAVLFTTNCLMPLRNSYADRVFTTEVVAYPGLVHIGEDKDFSPVINKALELGGYDADQELTGINGGHTVTTGFGRATVLSAAGIVVDAVKSGALKHIFLVGGCDGAKPGRNYYTEFVKKTPEDTLVLTLACGKFRFNDLDLGSIGGLPRIMDMGQCN
ncbi:MAG: hydroxylamine reductase, partial [Clostridiales bacterium]|nr:hydroxylamine reductase [Clostridiales bacterium]